VGGRRLRAGALVVVAALLVGCSGSSSNSDPRHGHLFTAKPKPADAAHFFAELNRRCDQAFPRVRFLEAALAAPERVAAVGLRPSVFVPAGFVRWYHAVRRLHPPSAQATVFKVQFVGAVRALQVLSRRAERQVNAVRRSTPPPYGRFKVGTELLQTDQVVKAMRVYSRNHHMPHCAAAAQDALKLRAAGLTEPRLPA